jgi:hypothetical protein
MIKLPLNILHRRLLLLSMLILASCKNTSSLCVPLSEIRDLQSETLTVVDWKLNITEDVTARVIVGYSGQEELTPRLVLFDTLNRRVSVTTMEKFSLSPLYTIWVDNEISKQGTDGKWHTTIYTVGYLPTGLYPDKHLFTTSISFRLEEIDRNLFKTFFYRTGEFKNRVFWFPASNLDYSDFKYIFRIRVDTEESLATDSAMAQPDVFSEWAEEYEPAINVDDLIIKMSQLDWVNIDNDTECGLSL